MGISTGTVHRRAAALVAFMTAAASALLMVATTANAATPTRVPLGTTKNFSVLGASKVTNTGASTLKLNLGISPGTSITGFPPGLVVPPASRNQTNGVAAQAQLDLTAAYVNAAGRPVQATTTANLANKHLQAGVYAGPSKGALQLTGPLVLDGAGNPNSVFIFQTNSSLTTASGSAVFLINGAQECNVYWKVGSSATLGSGSLFAGNILALTSITVNSSVTVHGRALARNAAVTLINDTFTTPTCDLSTPATTTPSAPLVTPPASPGPGGGAPGSGTPGGGVPGGGIPGIPGVGGPPRTDATPVGTESSPWSTVLIAGLLAVVGIASVGMSRRRVGRRDAVADGAPRP